MFVACAGPARGIAALLVVLGLGGCGGGGGSGGGGSVADGADPVTSFTSGAQIPSTGITRIDGIAVSVSSDGAGALQVEETDRSATATLTTAGGAVTSVRLSAGGHVTEQRGTTTPPGEGVYAFSTFGAWAHGGDRLAAGSFGAPTPAAALPTTTARFTGSFSGVASVAGATETTQYATDGTATLTTDFRNATLQLSSTRGTDAQGARVTLGQFDLTTPLALEGATYSGSDLENGLQTRVEGRFYGPAAEETGGIFVSSGPGLSHIGAFGARR